MHFVKPPFFHIRRDTSTNIGKKTCRRFKKLIDMLNVGSPPFIKSLGFPLINPSLEINIGIIASCIGCLRPLLWGHHVSLTDIVVVDPQTRQSGMRGSGFDGGGRETPSRPLLPMNPVRWIQRGGISHQKGPISVNTGGGIPPAFQTIIPPVKDIASIRGGDRGSGIAF